ncbi:SDR family NAD(P)-dependent oxidoreductase [Psychromonas sp. L1A2]|uniref:SDR family NAD(P)-dependent oxidoreductase n=1 Tax=Psychromonas sp. L1A2 TaxID=2686356 RepID=UPI0013575D1E|nr:SDR family oxidoreductase [Psychromonas sp. L1A2]
MIVLVTGAYGGIGRSVCIAYLKQATTLIISGRDPIKLDALLLELQHISDINIIAIVADVTDEVQISAMFKQIATQKKRLDVLVHCAGILTQKTLMLTRLSEMQQDLNTNLLSSILFCQQASKLMLRNKSGVITLISSIIASQGSAGQSVYGASKAGIEGLVKSLAKELGSIGIRINALAPGFINSELVANYDEQEKQLLAEKTCLKRIGEVEDIAPVVTFLSSNGARYITGQVIAVDGGLAL